MMQTQENTSLGKNDWVGIAKRLDLDDDRQLTQKIKRPFDYLISR
jgi:hypothetical protein